MTVNLDFEAFCRMEYEKLVGFIGFYCGSSDLGEELAHEALARACRDWKKVRALENRRAWVYRVALNLTRSYFRRKATEVRARRRLELERPRWSRESDALVETILVRSLVRALPRRQRTALISRHYLGLSVAETAELMDCPSGTVKTLTRRAVQSLQKSIEQSEVTEVRNAV